MKTGTALIRFLFALMVFTEHSYGHILGINLGAIGVGGFFLISGFTMHSLMQMNFPEIKKIKNYYFERLLRIYPSYFLVLTLVIIYRIYFSELEIPTMYDVMFNYFLVGINLSNEFSLKTLMTQTWSLAIEVQFYLLFPLIFFGRRKFTRLFISLSLFYFFLGVLGLLDKEVIYTNLLGTLWIFYLGKFCSEKLKDFTLTKSTVFYLLIPLLALALFQFEELTGQLTLGASIAIFYIVINLENRTVNFLNSNALKILIHFLGKITYPFFLIHSLAIGFVNSINIFSLAFLQWLTQLSFSLLIAFIMHYYFERRFIDNRRKNLF